MYYNKHEINDPVAKYGLPIWNKLFQVRVPNKNIQSTEELRMFGLPTVEDSHFDYQMHNQLIDIMITIDKMTDYFKQGVTVRLVKHNDAKVIFDIIDNYLMAWKHKLDRGINIAVAPLDDLLLLDKFAGVIYPHARDFMKPTDSITTIINSLGGIGHLLLPKEIMSDVELGKVETKETYGSLADVLSERIIGRSGGINTVNTNETQDSSKPTPFSFKPRWEK